MMGLSQLPNLRQYFDELNEELNSLRQNRLVDESSFIRFANERGIRACGVCTGDPGDFYKRGWLTGDGTNYDGGPLFHPFRIYPLFKTLEVCSLNIATSSTLRRDSVLEFIAVVLSSLPSIEEIGEITRHWSRAVDLAILLEPIYWPLVNGKISYSGRLRGDDFDALMEKYRQKVLHLVGTLDSTQWQDIHKAIIFDAYRMDPNDTLYLLLRVSDWHQREKLNGKIGGALWLRHIAEVIRRAFEEVTTEKWPEEDQATGWWHPGARLRIFGSERPIDDELKAKPYLALKFGLFTGSLVRWYVEGETEYFAIRHILLEPSRSGIELVNLRGVVQAERDNIALKLQDWLKEDMALRRYSMISFDTDVSTNVKSVRRQIDQKHVVGYIAAHKPDFEFANFTVQELAEIAARIDEKNGISGEKVRKADWTGVNTGKTFEALYKKASARKPRSLKGQQWGEALAAYILEYPKRPDDGRERPFWQEIQAALRARFASYDLQQKIGFDRDTFESVDLRAEGDLTG